MTDIKFIRLNCLLNLSNKDKTEELIKSAKELVSKTLSNDEGVEDSLRIESGHKVDGSDEIKYIPLLNKLSHYLQYIIYIYQNM